MEGAARAFATRAENANSVPGTRTVLTTMCNPSFRGFGALSGLHGHRHACEHAPMSIHSWKEI